MRIFAIDTSFPVASVNAMGLTLSLNKKIVPVTTFDAIAYNIYMSDNIIVLILILNIFAPSNLNAQRAYSITSLVINYVKYGLLSYLLSLNLYISENLRWKENLMKKTKFRL